MAVAAKAGVAPVVGRLRRRRTQRHIAPPDPHRDRENHAVPGRRPARRHRATTPVLDGRKKTQPRNAAGGVRSLRFAGRVRARARLPHQRPKRRGFFVTRAARGGDRCCIGGRRGEPHCIGMAGRIALRWRDGWAIGQNSSLSLSLWTRSTLGHAGDLQHLDHGRVLRVAPGLQADVRWTQREAGLPSRRGGSDQCRGLPGSPADQGSQGSDRDRLAQVAGQGVGGRSGRRQTVRL